MELDTKINDNQIKMDNINIKTHKVNYSEKIKKYNLSKNIHNLQYLFSEVKFSNLRKHIFIYSPLIVKNKTPYSFNILLYRKNKTMDDPCFTLEYKKSIGVPYIYLDGILELSLKSHEKEYKSVELKYLLNPNKNYYELLLGNKVINILISKNKV